MLEHLSNSPFLYSLSLTLLHFLWQGFLVALVLKSTLLIINHNKPQLRYALSSLAMLANLLLPIITFGIIYSSELALLGSNTNNLSLTELIEELNQPDTLLSYQALTELLPSLLPYISLLWLSTVTLLASKLLVEIYNVNKLPLQASSEPDSKLLARFNELAQQINLSITPRLLISLKVDVPMAIGWLKPVVLIPAAMLTGLNSAQLEMLILHELAHIRRHDYLVNFLQTFVEILLFFHPAVLWVSKQMRNEREYCSDDIAVQHCGNAIAYAHTLADAATLCAQGNHHHTIPTMAVAASGGDLKQRVIRLVDHHCAPQNNISKWFASAAIIFSVLLISSKQLLTMPLLDFWHNEVAFKNLNEPTIETRQVDGLLTINNSALNSHIFNLELPRNSLATQLLTPISIDNALTLETLTEQQQVIEKVNLTATSNTVKSTERFLTEKTSAVTSTKPVVQTVIKETRTLQANNEQNIPPSEVANQQQTQAISAIKLAKQDNNQPNKKPSSTSAVIAKAEHKTNLIAKRPANTTLKPTLNKANLASKKQLKELTDVANETIEASPIWRDARQLKTVNPVYPSIAKRKGIEIDVQVDFTIDINGDIKNIQFARQNKINYFKSSIRSAIKQWRFVPAKVDDQPVESQMTKVFSFNLQS